MVSSLGSKSILLNCHDEILKFRLSTHVMEGKRKLLETNPKTEEAFIPNFSFGFGTFIAILLRGNIHVLVSHVSLPVSGLFDWSYNKTWNPGIGTV